MKILLTLILAFVLSCSAFAQDNSIEKTFEKNKRGYSLKTFSIGEDASSGFDYLVYRQKLSTKKIRVIWSNYERATVDDYFYEFGKPLLLIKSTAKNSQTKSLAKGANLPLTAFEKFFIKDSKLVTWLENGKNIPSTDPRWAEKEKEVLESFEEQLETYRSHLRGEL
ncbi:MAG TPA: hypothetical protein PKY82_27745 [Pyrinomonadaceae bacterium]|nr:hypothetical protein [Pyrinomonadaceae bacterium]